MQIRLECYEHESEAALSAIRSNFNVRSVSKPYANVRQTGTETGIPCENRYYIKMDDKNPMRIGTGLVDMLTIDMLRFLARVLDTDAIDVDAEMLRLRTLYDAACGLTDMQVLQLFLEWKQSLVARLVSAGVET